MTNENNPPGQKYMRAASDLRQIVGDKLLALSRKEISTADALAAAKSLNAVSNAMNAETKMVKALSKMCSPDGSEMNTGEPSQRYMRAAGVCQKLQIAKSTLWNWVATREDFPKPMKAGPRVTLFDVQAIEKFISGSVA